MATTQLPTSVRVLEQPEGRSFAGTIRRRVIDDVAVVDFDCDPIEASRTPSHIAATEGEYLAVLVVRAGSERMQHGGLRARIHPGDVVLLDSALPVRCATDGRIAKRHVLVPRAAFDEVGGRPSSIGIAFLDGTQPATRLFVEFLESLCSLTAELPRAATSAARSALLALLVGVARQQCDLGRSQARPALRDRVERWIDRNLGSGVITPRMVAVAHDVSVRTVQRVFEADGDTFGGVVRGRRLARAREDLVTGNGLISTIAHRWGFADASHLTHAFKARYGTSPTEYRTFAKTAPAPVSAGSA